MGVGSSGLRKGGLYAPHSASWVCWAGFEDLRSKAASLAETTIRNLHVVSGGEHGVRKRLVQPAGVMGGGIQASSRFFISSSCFFFCPTLVKHWKVQF